MAEKAESFKTLTDKIFNILLYFLQFHKLH